MELKTLKNLVRKSWSIDTCNDLLKEDWTLNNPSFGQDIVTSLIVNEYFGGKIMACKGKNRVHYYNLIFDKIIDFTVDQFDGEIPKYEHSQERQRDYFLSDRSIKKKYLTLLKNINTNIDKKENNVMRVFLEKEEKLRKIGSKSDYINWVCNFLKKYTYFDDYPDFAEELVEKNSKDLNNIKDLHLFFSAIDRYIASYDGNIYRDINSVYYLIKYEDTYFKIGFLHGQGGTFYIQKEFKNNKAIDFNNIMDYYITKKPLTKKKTN